LKINTHTHTHTWSYIITVCWLQHCCRDIGPRSKVWSESEMIDAAAYEFAEVITTDNEIWLLYVQLQFCICSS